ncbi:ubiquitin hect domain family protein [Stylonychia lemnae]|uniref:HECT-type E3 ubiquitin transferase n=1 Tax=Stylonychia lemnae TaxID=5949 RepID=A0A078ATS2_STYLE|nr:ubiquitin hect domain family protein [Stylonychia lemnae]|eukprot:CDW84627.1 ubiquitin hect domain family protein [Stylonychia lemnae]
MRIIFTAKQQMKLMKQNLDQEEEEQGKEYRDMLLKLYNTQPFSQSEFLQQLENISDINIWKTTRINFLQWVDIFNILDDLLQILYNGQEKLLVNLQSDMKDQQNKSMILIILRFLKKILQYATNVQYFSSTDILILIFSQYIKDIQVIDEVIGVFITLSSKKGDKKSNPQAINYSEGLDKFDSQISRIYERSILGLIGSFEYVADLLLNQNFEKNPQSTLEQIAGRVKSQLDSYEKSVFELQNIIKDQKSLEDTFIIILKAINLYINVGDVTTKDKRTLQSKLESLLPPKLVVDKFIKILKFPHVSKKVHSHVVNIFFLVIILDLNSLFNYDEPTDNQYYQEACNHHEYYISTLQSLACYHSYFKLLEIEQSQMIDNAHLTKQISQMKLLVGDDYLNMDQQSLNSIFTETIKSQRFMSNLINLLLNLMNIKNRPLQNQLYPQFLKPLLAIVALEPVGNLYPININCQLKAAKLLKEVVKQSTIEDPGAVEWVIFRLKFEINVLKDITKTWELAQDDDTDNKILLAYRQDLIRTLLRFLSYSIIRNDPNAINFNQNFIANSRKILESNLIQEDIAREIFDVNRQEGSDNLSFINTDPILLQCLQLISYVFNDLPQKIPIFVENGFFSQILDSLNSRIPIQPDLFTIFMKFIQTLCLNDQSMKLIISSGIIGKFVQLAHNSRSYRQLVSQTKAMQFKDLIQQIALNNQALSNEIYTQIIRQYQTGIEKAWEVTKNYIVMEERVKNDLTLTEEHKTQLRFQYEREQISLEQTFESITYLLWYFAIDEQIFRQGNLIHEAISQNKEETIVIFKKILSTPIISSGCPNMLPYFSEIMLQILHGYGPEDKTKFMIQVMEDLVIQIENVYKACETNNLDSVADLEGLLKTRLDIILDERLQSQSNQNIEIKQLSDDLISRLSGEDQCSVIFAKISVYCSLIRQCQQPIKVKLIKDHGLLAVLYKLFKIQSLVNRFHASKYGRDLHRQVARLKELTPKYQHIIDSYNFKTFQPLPECNTEEEVFKSLYYNYEYLKLDSVVSQEARKNQKTIIELQLDENISHTSNLCQTNIRKLLTNVIRIMNKKKMHFTEQVDIQLLEFNREIGKLIAEQYKDFERILKQKDDELEVMKYCCQYSAIFGVFNKIIFHNSSFGSMFLSFVYNDGLEQVKNLVLYLIDYQYKLHKQQKPFMLKLSRSIQLLWSHLVDFYIQLIEAKYLDWQFSQYLISFKTNPCAPIKSEDSYAENELAVAKMQKYYMSLYGETLYFLFSELNDNEQVKHLLDDRKLNIFEYFDMTSELFFISFCEIYVYVSEGLTHIKLFNDIQLFAIKDQSQHKSEYNKNKDYLLEMGYPERMIDFALEQEQNDLEAALDFLNTSAFDSELPEVKPKKEEKKVESDEPVPVFDDYITYSSFTKLDLLDLIRKSIGNYLKFIPQNFANIKKHEVIDKIYFTVGKDFKKNEIQALVKDVKQTIIQSIVHGEKEQVGVLAYSLACLMSYKRGELLDQSDLFTNGIERILDLYRQAIKDLRVEIDFQNENFNAAKVTDIVKQLDQCLSLFLYISEEAKITSDISKLHHMLGQTQQSQQTPTLIEIKQELEKLTLKNEKNIFKNNPQKTSQTFKDCTMCTIELHRSMHNMNQKADSLEGSCLQMLIKKSLENLNFLMNIKGYEEFDCQAYFLQNEGLKALFGIRFVSKDQFEHSTLFNGDLKKLNEIQVQSKILLQLLSQNEQCQVKVFENLIKSVLFIQFQQKFKQEEGQDIKVLLNFEECKQNQPKIQSKGSKKKKSQTPIKRSKSEDKMMSQVEERNVNTAFKNNNSKNLKQQIFKKQEYGDVLLEEFINFFSKVMQIQDLKSFLLACQNVCILKRKFKEEKKEGGEGQIEKNLKFEDSKAKNEDKKEERKQKDQSEELKGDEKLEDLQYRRSKRIKKNEESKKDQEIKQEPKLKEEFFICLNYSQLKDMIIQYGLQLQQQTGVQLGLKTETEKHQNYKNLQSFQEQIVFTFMDLFIDQIRDDKMIISQSCKQAQNPSTFKIESQMLEKGIKLIDHNHSIQHFKHIFDTQSILSHLTYIMTHNPMLVQSLLKHKDGKTYRFIIRNIYYQNVIQIDQEKQALPGIEEMKDETGNQVQPKIYIVTVHDSLNVNKKTSAIVEFFKRVMLDNPHLTVQEKKLKLEARNIFVKEIIKNIFESQYEQKYPQWPVLGLIYNLGAIWLISNVLKDEEKDDQIKDNNGLEQLILNMQKFRNIIRVNMIKQLIHESQLMSKQQENFNLMRQLEKIQIDIIAFLPQFQNGKDQIQLCLSAISNILKPFDGNKNLWGEREQDKNSLLNESNLGFVGGEAQSSNRDENIIEEQDEEDEEDDDEEDDEEDDDSQENEDEDLLDSERSERNFRFSEDEEFDEDYGDDDDDDDDLDDINASGEIGGSIGASEEINPNQIDAIDDILRMDYGDEAEDDYFMEDDEDGEDESSMPVRQSQNGRSQSSQNPNSQDRRNQERGQNEEEAEEDFEVIDAGNDQDYGDEDADYGSDDDGEEPSDEYYDEELDEDEDDQQEIEIFVDRDANNQDRLSNIEIGGGHRVQMHRRDDILSMNNFSVDMFGMNPHHRGHLHSINEEQESQDFQSDQDMIDNGQDPGAPHGWQVEGAPNENLGGVLNRLLGMIFNRRQPRRIGQDPHDQIVEMIQEKLKDDSILHSPLETLTQIFELIKEIQDIPDVYKMFIREHSEANQNTLNQILKSGGENNQDDTRMVSSSKDMQDQSSSHYTLKNASLGQGQISQQNVRQLNQGQLGMSQSHGQSNIRANLAIADELDPEFLDNLDETGIRNLVDTENVMNTIHNQSSIGGQVIQTTVQLLESIQNRDQRNQLYRDMEESVFNQLPSHLFSEGLSQRPQSRNQQHALSVRQQDQIQPQFNANNLQIVGQRHDLNNPNNMFNALRADNLMARRGRPRAPQGRDRLISMDSQLNDLADFSRSANDPYFRNQNLNTLKLAVKDISSNGLHFTFLQYLKEIVAELQTISILDGKGNDIVKLSEQTVQHSLQLQGENYEANLQRVQGLIDTIMIWIKMLTNGQFFMVREQNLMRSLFRVTYIRQGIILKINQWLSIGVSQFQDYYNQSQGAFKQAVVNKTESKGFMVERGAGLPGRLDMIDFVLHCLRCFKQIAQECNKISTNASLDLMKIPSTDSVMNFLVHHQLKFDQNGQSFDPSKSIIEQVIQQVVTFVKLVDSKPELINQQAYVIEGKEVWMEDVIGTLVSIIQQLAQSSDSYQQIKKQLKDAPLSQQPQNYQYEISKNLINNLGELLLTKEFKSKEIQKQIKTIFGDINKINMSSTMVETFFKESLSQSLKRFIDIISTNKSKINNESLKKEVIILTQILKIAKGNKKQELNMCDDQLFFKVVKEISDLIDNRQKDPNNLTSASFILKDEFRTIMIALFILFEYNLKFIFTEALVNESPVVQGQAQANNRRRSGAASRRQNQGNAEQQGEKNEIIMEEILQYQMQQIQQQDKNDLMTAIEEHLRIKIKDEKARNDLRLKIFIKFCLEHKKIINSFIRANQQVLNDSLRNVIMKVPQLLDFDNKRLLFRGQIKKIQRKFRLKYIDIQVRRDKVFDDSFEQLRFLGIDRWKGKLNVEFADEQGIDEGGLTKEWFILLSQQIFNTDYAFFLPSNAGSSYYPNPKSNIQADNYIQIFRFVGHVVGKAIYEQQLLDCYFVKALYKIMLGLPLNYHDVEDFDNELYKNLSWCLSNSVENLGFTFTETVEKFGANDEIEIIPGGCNIDVTDNNKFEYVQKMAYHKLYGSIKEQVDSFLKGFYDIIPKNLIQIFDNRELELLISGLPSIDITDLRENTIYQNYSAESQVVKWLFEVLEEFDNSERAEFIQFVTGSSKVPVEGFKGLRGSRGIQKFQIVKFFTNDVNRLPQAHTCFKQLELPEYQSKQQLKDRLLTAIKEGKTFGFA